QRLLALSLLPRPQPRSTLFPYTTLFRSHLVEMAGGAQLTAQLDFAAVPRLPGVDYYLAEGCIPGGTLRNFDSYGDRVAPISDEQDRKSTRLNSSHVKISYAVFCLKKKKE